MWYELQKVLTMDKGDSFGERALIKNEDRSATIICSQDSAFATLSRIDYNWILGLAQKKEIKEVVEFLKGYRIFSSARNSSLEKIHYFMKR